VNDLIIISLQTAGYAYIIHIFKSGNVIHSTGKKNRQTNEQNKLKNKAHEDDEKQ